MKKARESHPSDVRRRVHVGDMVSVDGLPGVWGVKRIYSCGDRDAQQPVYVLRRWDRRLLACRTDFQRVYWDSDDSGAVVSVEPRAMPTK